MGTLGLEEDMHMTLVARLSVNDYPAVIGDLMLSIQDPHWKPAAVPTRDDAASLYPQGWTPYGLRQKLAVVSDNLVMGWSASDFTVAKRVIAGLKAQAASQIFTMATLNAYFDAIPAEDWKKLRLVGVLEEPNQQVAYWGRGQHDVATKHFGRVGVIGSGTKEVEEVLLSVPAPPVGDRTLTPGESCISSCLHLTGNLMQVEMKTGQGLRTLYGGGYEIATNIDEKYQKAADITYLFWDSWIHDGRFYMGHAPYKAFRYAYEKDILIIRSVSFDDTSPTPVVTEEKNFFVEPVYRDVDPTELQGVAAPSLNGAFLCVYAMFPRSPGKGAGVVSAVHRKSYITDEKWVTFTESAKGVTGIKVEQDFLQMLANGIVLNS